MARGKGSGSKKSDKFGAPGIIIKSEPKRSMRQFFFPHDKGSGRPAFCYPENISSLKEDTEKLEKLIQSRMIHPSHELEAKDRLRQLKGRLKEIEKQQHEVKTEMSKNREFFTSRREELAVLIREHTPSKSQRKLKKVSGREIYAREKGLKGKLPALLHGGETFTLEEAKREFMMLSKALGEDSDISHVEKD